MVIIMVMFTIILDQGRSYYSLAFVKKAPARPRVAKPPKILITIFTIIMLVDDYTTYGLQLIWRLGPGWSNSQYIGTQRASPRDNACKISVLFVILRIICLCQAFFVIYIFPPEGCTHSDWEFIDWRVHPFSLRIYEHRDCWPRLWHQHHYHCPHLWQHHHHPDLHNQGYHLSGRCPIKWRFLQKLSFTFQ